MGKIFKLRITVREGRQPQGIIPLMVSEPCGGYEMEKRKKRWGDRKDGYLVRDEDALHVITGYLMPNRTDNEAFISEQIDLTAINEYLKKKNYDGIDFKYTFFHVILAAVAKTIIHRPKMNRFIKGGRMYDRNTLSLSFVAKKLFADDGAESLTFVTCDENSTIDSIHDDIKRKLTKLREPGDDGLDSTTKLMNKVVRLPRFIMRFFIHIMRICDYYGKVPKSICKEDPEYASVFLSNLGSIKLKSGYHHLTNWGTTSIFIVVGEKKFTPIYDENGNVEMKETLNLGLTIDERLADGYYYSRTVKLLKYLLQNPELLDLPAKEEVNYEQ